MQTKVLGKVPEVVMNLPGLIKGSRMSKITDTTRPLGLGVVSRRWRRNSAEEFGRFWKNTFGHIFKFTDRANATIFT